MMMTTILIIIVVVEGQKIKRHEKKLKVQKKNKGWFPVVLNSLAQQIEILILASAFFEKKSNEKNLR